MVEGEKNKGLERAREGRIKEERSKALILKEESLNRGENIPVGKQADYIDMASQYPKTFRWLIWNFSQTALQQIQTAKTPTGDTFFHFSPLSPLLRSTYSSSIDIQRRLKAVIGMSRASHSMLCSLPTPQRDRNSSAALYLKHAEQELS
ncbi:hypothetical protein PAMP_011313 [Pampus punctatissimus]